ncbi:class IIb bacteriocin, lactobin A/cerein 7B family [Lactiplantibacillus plantarum]|uniref:class IIb bacteriocin, lactobin A/cerein 7B family n=1 Tax=Lactiplantibacillus plantarum TaxID=1590 RepID=UPI0037BF565C
MFRHCKKNELSKVNGGIWQWIVGGLGFLAGDAWSHSDQISSGIKKRKKKGYGY